MGEPVRSQLSSSEPAPLVARMDADDIAPPERLAVQKAWMDAHPETILLAQAARHHGAAAASAFGAGFGGCVWALVRSDGAADFLQAWAGAFHERFPRRIGASHFFTSPAGPAAFELNGTE